VIRAGPLGQGDGCPGELDGFAGPAEAQGHPTVEGQRLGLPGAVAELLEQLTGPPELRLRRLEVAEIPAREADAQRQTGREVVVVRPGPLGQLVGGQRLGEASGGGPGVPEVREQCGPLLVAAETGGGGELTARPATSWMTLVTGLKGGSPLNLSVETLLLPVLVVAAVALIVLVLRRRGRRRGPTTPDRPATPTAPTTPARATVDREVRPARVAAPVSPAAPAGAHLGVDFGTSNTAAVLRTPDGRRLPMLFDGSPLLPSAVFAGEDGRIAVGRDALHLARTAPECFEPAPKRCIDDVRVLLGGREHAVADLIAAVLARVLSEARRTLDGVTPAVTVTHPASWGPTRRETLAAAARRAGAPSADLLPEPVAAARFLTRLHGTAVEPGTAIVVYDFGAGTFDATVLVHRDGRFDVAAAEGLNDTGGRDIDEALLRHLADVYAARDPGTWQRLERPATPADRRARWTLLDDVRTAKEMLSRASSTLVHVPLFDDQLLLTRDQLERLAAPIVDRTVAATKSALWAAGPAASRVGALFLVGGSSRLPLATTALHRAIAVAPTTLERPETVVAEGATTAA
jgi:hypothetical protein